MIRFRPDSDADLEPRRLTNWRANARDAVQLCITIVALLLLLFVAACRTTEPARTPDTPPAPETPEAPRGPVTRTVEGFRIQIGMFNDRAEADEHVEAATNWYRNLPPSQRPPYLGGSELDVHVAWRAPYYRVQVGRFANRAEANRTLDVVTRRFPDAFPVPAVVTVTR